MDNEQLDLWISTAQEHLNKIRRMLRESQRMREASRGHSRGDSVLRKPSPARTGVTWHGGEDGQLLWELERGLHIEAIAERHQRTELAIRYRIAWLSASSELRGDPVLRRAARLWPLSDDEAGRALRSRIKRGWHSDIADADGSDIPF